MKKVISITIILIFILANVLFVGCETDIEQDKALILLVKVKTLIDKDKDLWQENEYQVSSIDKSALNLVYGYCEDIEVTTSAKMNTREELPKLTIEENPDFGAVLPGQYVIKRGYEGYETFVVKINILEYRPELTVTFDGGEECIEQKTDIYFTESWTPKYGDGKFSYFRYYYDGGWHYPSITLNYEGNTVFSIPRNEFASYIISGTGVSAVGRGYYVFDIEVDSEIFDNEYKNAFRKVRKSIHIKIE